MVDRGQGDFNGDGKPDLLLVNDITRQAIMWYMGGPGTNGQHTWDWLAMRTRVAAIGRALTRPIRLT